MPSRSRTAGASLTAAALFAVVLLAGCQQLEQRFTPEPTIVTEETTVAATGAEVVGELDPKTPGALPLWPGATVEQSGWERGQYTLVLSTTDTFDDVVNGLGVGLERAGWEVSVESGTEGQEEVLGITGNGKDGLATITAQPDGTTTIEYLVTSATE